MADHKFTLEEILNEYSEDGRRSGIRHTSDKPLSHGTLETEKLVNAATSSRPLRQEQAGYDQVVPELSAGDEEQLVDIKSTISHIKADKAAQAARDVDAAPVLRERFPTQHLRRENVSFVKAAGAARYGASYPENGDSGYDGAVMLAEPETEEPAEKHRPNVRQMQDSTRAREKEPETAAALIGEYLSQRVGYRRISAPGCPDSTGRTAGLQTALGGGKGLLLPGKAADRQLSSHSPACAQPHLRGRCGQAQAG